jgi:hypothetical protein
MDKVEWIKVSKTIHKFKTEIDIHGSNYIKTECDKLILVTNASDSVELLDTDHTEFTIKQKNEFCYDCRSDVEFIKNYE